MNKRFGIRNANGVVSAAIVAFFLVHGALGASPAFLGLTTPLAWIVWIGVGLVVVHVALSVGTSIQQLTDTVRPPSIQKKRHLLLKWATGLLLALVAGMHIAFVRFCGAGSVHVTATGIALTLALVAVLAWHICVGSKSLLKDLNIDRRYRTPLRACVCVVAALIGIAVIVGFLR